MALSTPSVSEALRTIDEAAMAVFGSKVVEKVMRDIHNDNLTLRQVADNSGVSMGDVMQIARYHRIDPVTLESTA